MCLYLFMRSARWLLARKPTHHGMSKAALPASQKELGRHFHLRLQCRGAEHLQEHASPAIDCGMVPLSSARVIRCFRMDQTIRSSDRPASTRSV